MANSCKYCNELSDSINDFEITDHVNDLQLLKKALLFGLDYDVRLYTSSMIATSIM